MTVKEMVILIESDMSNWGLVKGTFIDEFNNADMEQKNDLVKEEPEFRLELPYFVMPFIASMVHKFCTDNEIEKPDWVWKSKYFCQKPYFPKEAKGNLKTWLLLYSPPQFKYRNLYVDPDSLILDRVLYDKGIVKLKGRKWSLTDDDCYNFMFSYQPVEIEEDGTVHFH